ncbi:hypothetical protein [Roseospirillum parvum]|uniref:Uncharacterized protein n=1 Tax=Roseospirillum parvum TaxID=83401 RepID=A0A1G8FWB0_9PROT|nr:hypothetical protein [Roseospirillum parvum]SDH86397.1 hypothetical protein SAMN05421742_1173 [Roseospirillum parvum]
MGPVRTFGLAFSMLGVSACAGGPFEWKYGHDKIVPGQFPVSGDNGSVLTWPSYAVGAVVYQDGKACIQSTQSAKARDRSGTGNITLNLPATFEGGAELGQTITETISKLQEKDEIGTFTDVALFHVCTLAANGALTEQATAESVQSIIQAAQAMAGGKQASGQTE